MGRFFFGGGGFLLMCWFFGVGLVGIEPFFEVLFWMIDLVWYSNLANTASLVWHAYRSLPGPSGQVNWVGMG